MIRIIEKPFGNPNPKVRVTNGENGLYESVELKNFISSEFNDNSMYSRTLAGIRENLIEDLDKRASWTNKMFFMRDVLTSDFSSETYHFYNSNNINENHKIQDKIVYYQMIKYEPRDFFAKHIDTKLDDFHQYTCLIFCPQTGLDYTGGDLIFTNKTNTFNATIKTSEFKEITIIIFSLDLYHEINPITSGNRFVLKKPLFVREFLGAYNSNSNNDEVNDLDDGGGGIFKCEGGGDY